MELNSSEAVQVFNEHMSFEEVSAYLATRGIKIAEATLRSSYDNLNTCPPSAKLGRNRYFRRKDVDSWIDIRFDEASYEK